MLLSEEARDFSLLYQIIFEYWDQSSFAYSHQLSEEVVFDLRASTAQTSRQRSFALSQCMFLERDLRLCTRNTCTFLQARAESSKKWLSPLTTASREFWQNHKTLWQPVTDVPGPTWHRHRKPRPSLSSLAGVQGGSNSPDPDAGLVLPPDTQPRAQTLWAKAWCLGSLIDGVGGGKKTVKMY